MGEKQTPIQRTTFIQLSSVHVPCGLYGKSRSFFPVAPQLCKCTGHINVMQHCAASFGAPDLSVKL